MTSVVDVALPWWPTFRTTRCAGSMVPSDPVLDGAPDVAGEDEHRPAVANREDDGIVVPDLPTLPVR